MKLSEMTTNQASELLIRVSTPMANILDDDETDALIRQTSEAKGMSVAKMISGLLPKLVSVAIVKHKDDLYEIIGAFAGKSRKQVGEMNILETMKVLKESVDEDFIGFFKSSSTQGVKPEAE